MHDGRHKVHSKSISCVFIESLDDDAENEVETTTRKESRSNDKDGKDEVMEDLDGLIENQVMEEVQPSEDDDESDSDFVDDEYGIDDNEDDLCFQVEVDIDGEWAGPSQEPCAKPELMNIYGFEDNEDTFAVIDSEQLELILPHDSDEDNTEHAFPKFNVQQTWWI
ncbi:hypothetical protein L3X38_004228 [Prunus dulcis]|uniref:Uncharacterized protein n=1 Tax=Prunus dulcis TaxID=3755 RepID=A0AAD4ZNH3_PRUDU|nr:hypothetical protein L3X38_004228 [Prunus dulcis]